MRATKGKHHQIRKRFALVIGVAAVGVMALGAQTGAQTQAPTPPPPTCDGKPATIVGTSGNDSLGGTPADDVIVLAEGGELEPKAVRPVLLAFERIRRLVRKIAKLEASLRAKRRSAVYRRNTTAAIGTARQAIQKTVADMPLKPALIDDIVAQVRRRWEQINTLDRQTGEKLAQFGRPGRMAGEFKWVHNMAIDSKGNLYTSEVGTGRRVQKFKRSGGPTN